MDKQVVIPISTRRRFQQFGMHVMPKLTCALTLVVVIYLWSITVTSTRVTSAESTGNLAGGSAGVVQVRAAIK